MTLVPERQAAERRAVRLGAAFAAAAVVVLGAPFVGQLRGAILARFPEQYRLIIGGIVLASTTALVLTAVVRIRDRRASRYGALAASVAIGVACALGFRTGNANVDAVEAFHFVEYGVVTLLFYRVWRSNDDASAILFPVFAGIVVGTLDEWFQWFVPERAGEMRDVLLNGVAAVCGILFSLALDPPRFAQSRARPGALTRLGAIAALVLLMVGAFFATVHLGYEVRDPEIGVFRSRDTPAGLASTAMDRENRWRERPPVVLTRFSREDQYLSEALWHVRKRNEAVSDGDFSVAWRENRILEKFYAPVLDVPSYDGPSGHRWPAEQRADIEARNRGVVLSFESDANPYPIYTWSKVAFWAAVAIGSGFVFAVCIWSDRQSPGWSGRLHADV
jgi:VanZ like protein